MLSEAFINMENVYELHQHTYCAIIHIGKEDITTCILPTSNRHFYFPELDELTLPSFIAYNKERTKISCLGRKYGKEGKDDIVVDNFRNGLHNLFKKNKGIRDEEDKLLMKAVSDYLPAVIKETVKEKELEIESFDLLHYAFIVPSEWEEEMRDDIIRPIFILSGLISKQDHQDRLLFFTDIESICYKHSFERGDNTVLCRHIPEEEKVVIKLDLIQTRNTLFNFPNAKLFPKVINSISVSVTTDDVESRIEHYLKTNLDDRNVNKIFKLYQDSIIKAIIEGINSRCFPSLDKEHNTERDPLITFKKRWMLNESQKDFINSLCPSVICAEIGTFLLADMKNIVLNNFSKSYRFLLFGYNYYDQGHRFKNGIKWLEYILEYNSRSLCSISTITRTDPGVEVTEPKLMLEGAGIGVFEAIQNSDIYCKPRIVSSEDLITSPSVFLNSKPDAIVNLDISLRSTVFTCSFLDKGGMIQHIFNHDYFIKDKHLPPLGHFFTFSNTTTLNVKKQFIPFPERYLLGNLSDFTVDGGVSVTKDLFLEMKYILTNGLSDGEVLVSTDTQNNIEAFILMYMIYIKEEMLYNFPYQLVSAQMNMKIGYAVSIEAMLLNNTLESKDNLRDIIYASGLVQKDDNSKKLRITTQGEGILPAIQKSLKLELALKSYFLLCQLHEDYVQLSLHQVVTEPNPEEKYQESIIVQDEILSIQNIYDSLCLNMWCNLVQDSSLLELCEIHNTSDKSKIIDFFSLNTKTEFFANLKRHISDNILQNNPDMRSTNTVKLTNSCKCKVHLTTSDIIDISFTPVLQDIACTLYASLLNKELFGNYMNIDYLFSIIHFNNNPQLRYAFARILEEEADDFNLELGIDTSCLVVHELFNQLLQPVILRQPYCYKDFKNGALQQVCSKNYVACITDNEYQSACPIYNSKITDKKIIAYDYDIPFPFLSKGEIINNIQSNRIFYLRDRKCCTFDGSIIELCIFKTMKYMENNEMLSHDDHVCQHIDSARIEFSDIFKWQDVDVPIMVSIRYVSYTSSLQFSVKLVGADTKDELLTGVVETGEPLTLTRF